MRIFLLMAVAVGISACASPYNGAYYGSAVSAPTPRVETYRKHPSWYDSIDGRQNGNPQGHS